MKMMTAAQFVALAETRLTRIVAPATLAGRPIAELQKAAASAPDDADEKDRMVYMLVNGDCSLGRVGEGRADRPIMSMAAYLINATPEFIEPLRQRRHKNVWSIAKSLYDMIEANGSRLSYIVLAESLSKRQAQAGEQAMFDLLGLRKYGGWLINEARH
jgi:hypothetical protein